MPASSLFAVIFTGALSLTALLRLWLSWRQIRHVGANRDKVPDFFSGRIDLASHRRAADYCVAKTKLGIVSLAAEIALILALTYGGGLQAASVFWSAHLDGGFYGVALILSVMCVSGIVDLPFSLYAQFVIEEKFGFNRMTLRLFFIDLAKQAILGLLIGAPVLLAVLWLMEKMGSAWWFHVWLFWCGFNLLILFIYPTWIAPLFNTFIPLDDEALRARIDALLKRCGFAASGVFVMDGSKRSSHGNAYFTGFGKTKRIVFFDTLLKRLEPSGIEAVLAHELGHFKHRHIVKRIALLFLMSLALLAVLGQLSGAEWFYRGLGVEASGTAMALNLFFLVSPVFVFPLTPLMSLLSRENEFEADRYAVEHTSANALIDALVRLYDDNAATLTPDPVHSMFYDSHPTASARIGRLAASAP